MTLAESHILVVDDEPSLRLTFSLLLQQTGATVRTASDGAEAINMLRQQRADLILTDLHMPLMDGVTMLRTLAEEGVRIPSVLFISSVVVEDWSGFGSLGVLETIRKPIHPRDLEALLERLLAPLPAA